MNCGSAGSIKSQEGGAFFGVFGCVEKTFWGTAYQTDQRQIMMTSQTI